MHHTRKFYNTHAVKSVYQINRFERIKTLNWLNGFELMCYIIVAIMLVDLFRKNDYNYIFAFGTAALVGFSMELMAVSATDIYFYNPEFWLNLGHVPKQFPLFGGFMWGGLTVYGMKLAKKLGFGKVLTALSAGMFIVTMDILLDVVAIRLGGGFWTWAGKPINTQITQSTFMSVIWVNFLGYMIETPAVVWLILRKNERVDENNFARQTGWMFLIAFCAIIITSLGSLAALGLNAITNDWFSCIAFIALWSTMVIVILIKTCRKKLRMAPVTKWNLPMLIFWTAMYAYCIAAVVALGLHNTCPWFLAVGFLFAAATLFFAVCGDESARMRS